MKQPVIQKTMSGAAWAQMGILACVWGASFLSMQVALDEIGVASTVAHRVFWASLALWAVVLVRGIALPRGARVWGAFLVMGLINNVIPFGLMAWGLVHIESGLAAIFNAATALFGVLIAALFLADERLTPRKLMGVCLGLGGVIVAIGIDSIHNFDLRSLAQLAVLAGTVCYALAGVWARRTLGQLPPQTAAAGMLTGASIVMVPVAWMLDGAPRFDLEADTLFALGYVSLIATAGAFLLYYRVLSLAGSGNLMLVTLMVAPVAIILGALVRDESLPPNAYAGFVLLAAGLVIIDGRVIDRRARPR